MPSRAVYTGLALARSVTGCSTVLIPSVAVMVTPRVSSAQGCSRRQRYGRPDGIASRILIGSLGAPGAFVTPDDALASYVDTESRARSVFWGRRTACHAARCREDADL